MVHSHLLYHPQAHHRICRQGRTGRPFPQCPGGQNPVPHPGWTWSSTTTNTNTHWQHHYCWNCQQHHQATTIPLHGNVLLLVIGWQNIKVYQMPWQENLGKYPSKHHMANIHQHVRPYYVHTETSPTILPRALKRSIQHGCAEILGDPYAKKSPACLPKHP